MQNQERQQAMRELELEERKRRIAITTAIQGINQSHQMKINEQSVAEEEKRRLKEQMDWDLMKEENRLWTQRAQYANAQHELKNYLLEQQKYWEQEKVNEKEMDKWMAEIQAAKEYEDSMKRNDYFLKLWKFQEETDMWD